MDDDTIMNASKVKTEASNKVKDGYLQLAEKMEQVKNQVAKIERKYDELYQTVKATRSSSMISETDSSQEEQRSQRESIDDVMGMTSNPAPVEEAPQPPSSLEVPEEKNTPSRKSSGVDIEKMENNPFV